MVFTASSRDFNRYTFSLFLSLSYQDLTREQARSEKLATELAHLSQKLQRSEAERQLAKDSLHQSQERIESLSQLLKKSESLQLETRRESAQVKSAPNSNSESTDKQDMSPLDQSPEAAKGCDLSTTRDHFMGEAERHLSERVIELEKEVCIWMCEWVFGGWCGGSVFPVREMMYIMLKFLL